MPRASQVLQDRLNPELTRLGWTPEQQKGIQDAAAIWLERFSPSDSGSLLWMLLVGLRLQANKHEKLLAYANFQKWLLQNLEDLHLPLDSSEKSKVEEIRTTVSSLIAESQESEPQDAQALKKIWAIDSLPIPISQLGLTDLEIARIELKWSSTLLYWPINSIDDAREPLFARLAQFKRD